jgi:hypothetical protein
MHAFYKNGNIFVTLHKFLGNAPDDVTSWKRAILKLRHAMPAKSASTVAVHRTHQNAAMSNFTSNEMSLMNVRCGTAPACAAASCMPLPHGSTRRALAGRFTAKRHRVTAK